MEKREKEPRRKMTRDIVPDDFTLTLALVDAIPVVFFGASMLVIGRLFSSLLFLIGAFLCLTAGVCKVLWKIIVVLKKKNIWMLFLQMRILMPIGFAMMLLAVVLNAGKISPVAIGSAILSFPSVIFFAVGVIGMGLMMFFAVKLDSSNVKANWIEQLTNGIAQAAIFTGLLFLM